jgi:hypothetical protein
MCMRSSTAIGAVNAVRRKGIRHPQSSNWAVRQRVVHAVRSNGTTSLMVLAV